MEVRLTEFTISQLQITQRDETMLSRMNLVLVAGLAVVLCATVAWATPLSPLALTGYTADVIFGPAGTNGGYAIAFAYAGGMDDDGAMYVNGTTLGGTTYSTGGLPAGSFASALDATHTYLFADAGGNTASPNALVFSGTSKTLSLATPGKFDQIGVLAAGVYGGGQFSATLNYSDGTTTSFTYNAWDWGQTSSHPTYVAYTTQNVVHTFNSTGQFNYMQISNPPWTAHSYYETVTAVDPTKTLQGVTFSSSGSLVTGVFAISGDTVPEPGTVVLLAAGLAGLLCYAWRKRR